MATEQELQSLFNDLDRDQDGKVSINELFLSPGLSAIISAETNTSRPQDLLAWYDLDESAVVSVINENRIECKGAHSRPSRTVLT